jgi:hypothetical protein
VQVDDAIDRRVTTVLAFDVLPDRPYVVAQVFAARGLDSTEDAQGVVSVVGGARTYYRRVGLAKAGFVAALASLIAAGGAQAAYAPKLAIKVDPTTPSNPSAITSTITQESGETANKTIKVTFPAGFTVNTQSKITPCTGDQEQSDTCPPGSQVGDATAETALGALSGPVDFESSNGQLALIVYLNGFGGLVNQKIIGKIAIVGSRIQTTFDNLPNTPTTSFQLALQGGDKALSRTPATCGKGVFDAAFTSQNDEQAVGQAPVDIEGCASTPVVSALSVSPKSFRAVSKFSDTQRKGYGTTLRWTLSEATNGTRVTVLRRVAGHFRKAGSFIGSGDQGQNTVKWDGRIHSRPLEPGAYRFSLQTTSHAGKRSVPVTAGFKIRR